MRFPHSLESIDEELRIKKHDKQDRNDLGGEQNKFISIDKLPEDQPELVIDLEQSNGYLDSGDIYEEEDFESRIKRKLAEAKECVEEIQHPLLKKVAERILNDAKKSVLSLNQEERKFDVYINGKKVNLKHYYDYKYEKDKIETANIVPKGWRLKRFDRYFIDIFGGYQEAVKKIKKINVQEIRFIFENVYKDLSLIHI